MELTDGSVVSSLLGRKIELFSAKIHRLRLIASNGQTASWVNKLELKGTFLN